MIADEFLGLNDYLCTTEEDPITDEEILPSLVSNADVGDFCQMQRMVKMTLSKKVIFPEVS